MRRITGEIRAKLIEAAGVSAYFDDEESLLSHSYDATPMLQAMPEAVIYAQSTNQVSAVLKICHQYEIPVYTRGAASNLCGGTVPVHGGVVLVTTRMNRLLEIDEENLTATFETGLTTKALHQAVEAKGLFYPPDPGSMLVSTLGGNIAQCAGGLRGLKYGTTKDYVIGLTAVLPNGEVIHTGGKLMKDVAGYDLTKLLVGSEGTLAVITEATVKLLPKPQATSVMLAYFDDMYAAARTVSKIIAARIIPSTLEFMDHGTILVVEDYAKIGLPTDMKAILLIGQDGHPAVVEEDMEKMRAICMEEAREIKVAKDMREAEELMTARRSALSALARLKPTTILEDATVPRSQIATMVEKIAEIGAKYNVRICTFGHAGDGNLHPTCMTDARDQDEIERVEEAFEEIFAAALELGGTITGEHGVGIVKAPFLEWKVGPAGIEVMKGIKRAFDPKNILNPGKMFAGQTRKRVVINR
ncbi:glycolate oxidase [Caldalkalibacillus uzonensis]|uniref:Glycolate oxidase n=1 Tax=Caldalkalibacillus uzonensis TaxID=353224 RepID=A0ABU0CUF1_9BACI|nr:glycolate oxidase [Caldalkalibacillus uzonensis]